MKNESEALGEKGASLLKQGFENKLSQWDISEKEAGLTNQHNETKQSVNEQIETTQDRLAMMQDESENKFDLEKSQASYRSVNKKCLSSDTSAI
ncbi:MAG: hypothetical protein H0V82_03465 [Candidatus Protochlamydia sp.]|nr:hypothetical protein [Candidatus Protochlamydia sp.]